MFKNLFHLSIIALKVFFQYTEDFSRYCGWNMSYFISYAGLYFLSTFYFLSWPHYYMKCTVNISKLCSTRSLNFCLCNWK